MIAFIYFLLYRLIFLLNYLFLIMIPCTFIILLSCVINLKFLSHKLGTINLIFELLKRLFCMISSNLLNKSSPSLFKIVSFIYTNYVPFICLIFQYKLLQIIFIRYFQITLIIQDN